MRCEIRPLGLWTDPETPVRQGSGIFKAGWQNTLDLLDRETDHLGAQLVVIQVDVQDGDLRRDGMLRSRAAVGHPGVAVSFESRFGPLRYATDRYEPRYYGDPPGWQANVRAVALALEALRAVDRYGVSKRGEQYRGWNAIAAPGAAEFGSADEALRWMRAYATGQLDLTLPDGISPRDLYRFMAKLMHPDRGGPRAEWDRLAAAQALLETKGGKGA
jgi:hypothetical protein